MRMRWMVCAALNCVAVAQVATTTSIASSPSTVYQGQTETTTVTVTAQSGGAKPTGTVQILADGQVLASEPLSNGTAKLTTNTGSIPVGSYQVTAVYGGASGFAKSQSGAVAVTVDAARPTVTQVWVSPTNVPVGGTGHLTARVARKSDGSSPTGSVKFYADGELLGTANLDSSGTATFTTSANGIPLGQYTVTAVYAGGNGDASSTSAGTTASVIPANDVLTYRYNSRRTGVQSAETQLTPANVNSASFGKVATYPVDGFIYAQPLYVSGYTMSDGKAHNVVFAATVNGTIYAFDADGNNPAAGYLWKTSLVPSGERAQSTDDYGCSNPNPQSGVLATPVIDRNLGAIYAVVATTTTSGTTAYNLRLHALRLRDGAEVLGGPTTIQASVPGTGAGSSGGNVTINPLRSASRAALLEASGQVWVTLASHCDAGPYHGWTLAYSATDIAQQTAVNNNTPNGGAQSSGGAGGIWMSAGGPSTDDLGSIYTAAGNGTFDANTGGTEYGNSISRFKFTPAFNGASPQFSMTDWFVPDNQAYLTQHDLDNGMVSPLIVQDPTGSEPNLVIDADKTGVIYLLDRDNMGKYDTGSNGPGAMNGDVQEWTLPSYAFTNFAWFNNTLYAAPSSSPLQAFKFTPGSSGKPGSFNTTASSQTAQNGPGGSNTFQPVVSANGSSNAVLWALFVGGNDVLYAYDPANLATVYYTSSQATANRDLGPAGVKFTVPVVAGGKVFVGGQSSLVVYGLLGK